MTREEEIKKAAYNNDRESSTENIIYFIEGAEWADENPRKGLVDIDMACEWLLDNYFNYAHNSLGSEYLENDFRKAMGD